MTLSRTRISRVAGTLVLAAGLVVVVDPVVSGQQPEVEPVPGQPAFQPGPPRPMNQQEIERAIDRGVSWLRQAQKFQNQTGYWGEGNLKSVGSGGGWVVGYTCLAGIALVECGVPTSDPGLQAARRLVLAAYRQLDSTYEVALATLFLDRMGDPRDRGQIQGLAVRLIAGQTGTGGWAYKVPKDVSAAQHNQILSSLRKLNPPPPPSLPTFRDRPSALGLCIKMSDDIRPKPPEKAALDPAETEKLKLATLRGLPAGIRRLPVFMEPEQLPLVDPEKKNSEPVGGTTDNSNTHFAMLALWAARRHQVPTERSFALLFRRFQTSQSKNGGWGYTYAKGGSGSSNAMTCVGLLGVAIGHALNLQDAGAPRPENDQTILNAFKLLSRQVGEPTGHTNVTRSPSAAGGLYYLWALERIAVLYDVQSLDRKDWYQWGAEILVGHQQPDGSWRDGGPPKEIDHPVLSTALALLFLKRANLTPDLSKRLLVDPAALTATVAGPKSPAPMPKPMPEPEPSIPVFPFPLPIPATPEPEPAEPMEPETPAPTETETTEADSEPPASTSDSEDESSPWGTVVAVIVGLVVFGGSALGFWAKNRGGKPKGKKKGKSTSRKLREMVEEEVDDEEADDDEEVDDE